MMGVGATTIAKYEAMDAAKVDAARRRDAINGSDALLRAMLRAGNHVLPFAEAEAMGVLLGMAPGTVRAAPGDPTIARAVAA